jgi:hypothetical protein
MSEREANDNEGESRGVWDNRTKRERDMEALATGLNAKPQETKNTTCTQ